MSNDQRIRLLKNELTHSFENYIKNIDLVEVNVDWEYTLEDEHSSQNVRIIKSENNILVETTDNDNKDKININCINKDYFFSLTENNGSYIVDAVEKIEMPIKEKDFDALSPPFSKEYGTTKEYMIRHFALAICSGYKISHRWVFLLFGNPSFSIDSYEDTTNTEGERIVKVSFSCNPTDDCNIRGGHIELLPERYWQIQSGKVVFWDGETDYTMDWTINFSNSSEMIPYDLSFTNKRLDMNCSTNSNIKCVSLNSPIENSRFTLSYYGLPEPDFGEKRVNRLRHIIMITGLGLISLGIWRIYRRKQETSGV